MSIDNPKKFNFHYGDQGTLSEGLYEDIENIIEKYSDVMTLAGIIGVLEAVKFALYMESFVNYEEGEDDDDEDPSDTENEE
jgi:hypothetical protein